MNRWPTVALGDVLVSVDDAVQVSPTDVYEMVGVYNFGRGLFRKTPVSGAETSYKSLNRLRTGRFVYSRLFAWEGSVAVVTSEFDGLFVSTEFPVFGIDTERLLPQYLSLVCRWPQFHDQLARSTTGLGLRRQRVYEDALLALQIPLPPIDEQRRIAARISEKLDRIDVLNAAQAGSMQIVGSLMAAIRHEALSDLGAAGTATDLESVAEILMGTSPQGYTYNDVGSGMPLLNGPTDFGAIHPISRQWTSSPTTVARKGDLLMSVRASIGKMNWADKEYCVGRGLTAIRPRKDVDGRYLRHVLILLASEMMAMTAGTTFPNLPGAKLRKLAVPLPAVTEQQRLANLLDSAEAKVSAVKDLRVSALGTLKVLPSSILNAAFVTRT